MTKKTLRTPAEARAELDRKGISAGAWAAAHGYSSHLVVAILSGKRKCLRGQSHQIAVMLGIKEGEIASPLDVRRNKIAV